MTASRIRTLSMRAQFTNVAVNLLDTNRRIVVLTADIGAAGFQSAARRHPHRVVNVGIREQLLIGAAAGFALEEFRPIVHSYAPFLVERPYEQIKLDLSHQGVGAILVSTGASFDASSEGRTHQAPADVALLAALPGWEIHLPGHADELETLLRRAATRDTNVYLRMSEQSNRRSYDVEGISVIRFGSAGAATVLAIGPMLDSVLEATAGLDIVVAYTPTAKPLDSDGLQRVATGTDVIVVEPVLEGTSAAGVAGAVKDRPRRLLSIGVGETELRRYGSPAEHAAAHRLDARSLRSRIETFLST